MIQIWKWTPSYQARNKLDLNSDRMTTPHTKNAAIPMRAIRVPLFVTNVRAREECFSQKRFITPSSVSFNNSASEVIVAKLLGVGSKEVQPTPDIYTSTQE